ncbi:MAG TPA: DNA polymerase III subunit gamma/tau [Thermoanaerobaculia bacterium]|jgi:DNA polymerase-3 subunit gamma/tau|nr:DNA polymerase III subunit gamma/tau [Thermoanaerobaculia bacterium]
MSYQVLARKWRPQNFSSLVGQEPIVTALRNALREGRIAQAYLFSGIRGVGKTTAARVLAKALNCERGPGADPCNECTPCVEITRGGDMDVIEVDAATYSKVEQVRELTESLKYGPARDPYKVVVLDEIHRLSRQAFDALLKIVEEPPAHLVFIFATTEIEAVPATILSRCQEFHFRRVASQELAAYLRQICESESIQTSDTALRLIARAGEGSVRDSVAILDQLATFGSGVIADEDAVRLLGGLDTALFQGLLAAILRGDAPAVLGFVRRVEDEGWDPRHVYGQFLSFCRDALHLALGGDPGQIDLPREEALALAEIAKASGYENLLRMLHQLLASEPIVRRSETGVLAVEIAWLRAAELPKLVRVEELLAGTARLPQGGQAGPPHEAAAASPGPRPVPAPAPRAAAPAPRPMPVAAPAPSGPRPVAVPPQAARPTAAPTGVSLNRDSDRTQPNVANEASGATGADGDRLTALLEEVRRRRQGLAAAVEDARPRLVDDRTLEIPADDWLRAKLESGANRQVLDAAVGAICGPGATWRFAEPERPAATAAAAEEPRGEAETLTHPTVQTVLDIFGGRIERIEEHGSFRED